jgi:hypothetical protein
VFLRSGSLSGAGSTLLSIANTGGGGSGLIRRTASGSSTQSKTKKIGKKMRLLCVLM